MAAASLAYYCYTATIPYGVIVCLMFCRRWSKYATFTTMSMNGSRLIIYCRYLALCHGEHCLRQYTKMLRAMAWFHHDEFHRERDDIGECNMGTSCRLRRHCCWHAAIVSRHYARRRHYEQYDNIVTITMAASSARMRRLQLRRESRIGQPVTFIAVRLYGD